MFNMPGWLWGEFAQTRELRSTPVGASNAAGVRPCLRRSEHTVLCMAKVLIKPESPNLFQIPAWQSPSVSSPKSTTLVMHSGRPAVKRIAADL